MARNRCCFGRPAGKSLDLGGNRVVRLTFGGKLGSV
jgi:hypothetical protein